MRGLAQKNPALARPMVELKAALQSPGRIRTSGLHGASRGHVLAWLSRELAKLCLCVTASEQQADSLAGDLTFFLGEKGASIPRVVRLPADEVSPFDEVSADAEVVRERLSALFHLTQGDGVRAVVCSVRGLYRKLLPPSVVDGLSELVGVGQEYPRDNLLSRLVQLGYRASPLVEDPGTYAVRGGIVDVFSPLYQRPARLELFGDTIESLRMYDPQTQRTTEAIQELCLIPATEVLLNDQTLPLAEATLRSAAERINLPTSQIREKIEQLKEGRSGLGLDALLPGFFPGGLGTIFDYLGLKRGEPIVYLDDPVSIDRARAEMEREVEETYQLAQARGELTCPVSDHFLSAERVEERWSSLPVIEGGGLLLGAEQPQVSFSFGSTRTLREEIRSHQGEEGSLTPLVQRLVSWREEGVASVVVCGAPSQADRLRRLLLDRNLNVRLHDGRFAVAVPPYDPAIHAHLFQGEISEGFIDRDGGLAILSEEEIFGVRVQRRRAARKAENPFAAGFRDLKAGDLIVHTDFGIGRYAGLIPMEVQGVPGEFLLLEYAGKDKVYLPVTRMRLIQKFAGADPSKVALDKLGGQSWEKTKKRIKERLLQMAAELLRIYGARKAHPGFAFSAPDAYFERFEADFEFEETPDQHKAIEDVLADMQKPVPMDRLICGDVGYGKTEVAMRAAFKAVLDKKQVAVLVPTTVLAQQHYQTFQRRFAGYPVSVEVVSRMRRSDEIRTTLARAREGKVDILIGTHKLLGSDVAFKDLGLLIVDEEQRFGVKHKEQIKKLKTQVDVLTMTATPIPRTLNMAMTGVRDMSIIATPPLDRRAIRTFVVKFDPGLIREAITRELERGGQVFFVHNRVQSIPSMAKLLGELVPKASVGIAHGQMGEGQLEKVMAEFVDRKHQILLCTAIIESGIDIPAANTMIVNRADGFGLAQLYQLRGRVGRSKDRAYAYLLVPSGRPVTKEAQRRLEVLQAFTELGAGFTIASHDLEIRGAGNLLGPDQSGAIAEIGFELYAQLLDEAVAQMRGEPAKVEIEPEIALPVAALIPDDYVPDVSQRLLFYKRFAVAGTDEELSELRAELLDRYGDLPDPVDRLTELSALKIEMRGLRVRSLESGPGRIAIGLGSDAALDPLKVAKLVQRSGGGLRLTPEMKLIAKVGSPAGGQVSPLAYLGEAKRLLEELRRCAT